MSTQSQISNLLAAAGSLPQTPSGLTTNRLRELAKAATYSETRNERKKLDVLAPFTGEFFGSLPLGEPDDVVEACRRARKAQKSWAATTFSARSTVFKRYHDRVLENHEEALDLIQLESGKTRYDAFLEVGDVAVVSRYYAYHGEKAIARNSRPGLVPLLTQVEVNRVPVGVVGIIAPWNYPLTMAITDAIPALLAGNAVVIKPSEETPFSALWAAEQLSASGLPADLLHIIPGDGPTLGPTLIDSVDYLHFTGSTKTGETVAKQAAERLIGSSLELGGKNPLLVLEDADLDKAVHGAIRDSFASAGQLCMSAERIYVHQSLYESFVNRFAEKATRLKVGAGFGWDIDMGCLASAEQLDKVEAHVEDARRKGATIVTGGEALPDLGPLFYAPTILTDVPETAELFGHETFGPVVSVYPFSSDDEAVALANGTEYGLTASIWTSSPSRGRSVARQLRCGTVNINESYTAAWGSTAAPMGGFGKSGIGRRHGEEGITKYTEAQTIATQHLIPIAPLTSMTTEAFAGVVLAGFKLIRKIPGLR
ncbi:MAG: succinic semialdehyde dehydrogenase [Rubricoccaceae bacterium]|nr:succinic semialdehyde dehydrogenase [Rubricoccaceae bacterium]